jgi:hypothetical protein
VRLIVSKEAAADPWLREFLMDRNPGAAQRRCGYLNASARSVCTERGRQSAVTNARELVTVRALSLYRSVRSSDRNR